MKRKNLSILCFSILLCLVAVFYGVTEQKTGKVSSISVRVISDGGVEEVKLWEGPGERCYLFLPGYADLSEVYFQCNLLGTTLLDYKRVTRDTVCSDFPMNEPIELIHDSPLRYQWSELVIMQSAGVPTLYIDVQSGNMEHIHAEKGNKESGTMRLYSADGKLEAAAMVESLQGRGNSTWQWSDKKPYSLRLSTETDLLGMGAASRWVLLAEVFDPSLIKNKMFYDLAETAGMPFAPDCHWVELYLNGEYAGLYLLSERNEVHANRVEIPEENSFLVSWEDEQRLITQKYPYIKTDRGTAIRVHHRTLPLEEVQRIWQSAENAIFAEDGIDPVTGKHWQELIDMDSWAKLFLVDEISCDYDGGNYSRFFYYQEINGVGKIYGGPVWDKDDTLANGQWPIIAPNSIVASRSMIVDGEERKIFAGLYQKEVFSSRVAELYQRDFLPALTDLYETGIEMYADHIASAAKLNEIRWSQGDTKEKIMLVRDFLEKRMAFLNSCWIQKESFYCVRVYDDYDGSNGEFAVSPGAQIPALPETQPGLEWYVFGTEEPFDVAQPIWEDVDIIRKGSNGSFFEDLAAGRFAY